ncbi:CRISPR system precrRNA processing endoribonuclease RAMP protein Cas6 [Methyloglobulus sp.]|uniref:CRISPR system precrRNA processing endoribonuclease RAMP protein Cas6 n=1 Tax=Methyloglobulus sp. TaxID=2518622 RepID=UPI0039890C25
MTNLESIIPINAYRFYFAVDYPVKLPKYPGSAWRGAFGHALKKTVCVVRNTPCNQCLLKNACAYSTVFETPPPANAEKMRKYTAAPHPFVLQFPVTTSTSDSIYTLDVILFGHGQRYFPYIVHALQTAGQNGIGGHQQVFSLQKIDAINRLGLGKTIYQNGELKPQSPALLPAIPAMPRHIEITLHTPLRIKQDNKNLATREFNFGAFFSTLLRRISMISYFHTDTPLETDFAALTAKARTVQFVAQQLKWYDWTRYSSRQQTEMNMGGLIGSLQLDMQDLEEFWPDLWLGQWTNVGKGTSMGLGAYLFSPTIKWSGLSPT